MHELGWWHAMQLGEVVASKTKATLLIQLWVMSILLISFAECGHCVQHSQNCNSSNTENAETS